MRLQDRVKAAALPRAEGVDVADVRIGLGYMAVQLDNGWAGVAYTFLDEASGGCSVYRHIRPLAGRPWISSTFSIPAAASKRPWPWPRPTRFAITRTGTTAGVIF